MTQRSIEVLSPVSEQFLAIQKLQPLAEAFDANMDDLVYELHQTKMLAEKKKPKGFPHFSSLAEFPCY